MKTKIIFLVAILIVIVQSFDVSAQKRSKITRENFQERRIEERQMPVPNVEFQNIANGLIIGEVNQISRYFASQVYISLRTGEKGYYSSNQGHYLIENFFRIYSPINFQTTSKMIESSSPYLAGRLFCRFRSATIEDFQVFINLHWNGFKWEIIQLLIN